MKKVDYEGLYKAIVEQIESSAKDTAEELLSKDDEIEFFNSECFFDYEPTNGEEIYGEIEYEAEIEFDFDGYIEDIVKYRIYSVKCEINDLEGTIIELDAKKIEKLLN